MKICREDLVALRFALFTMEAVRNITADEAKLTTINNSIKRTRKVHMLLLSMVNQGTLGFAEVIWAGIDDESKLAKSIRDVCGDV